MTPSSPLGRLWRYAAAHRPRVLLAATWSVLNKTMDLAPPFLIGIAVDVVVRRGDSFVAGLGVVDPRAQLGVLAGVTLVVWGLESLFEYLAKVSWRNLAQTVEHELRVDGYVALQGLDLEFFESRPTGDLVAVLNDDVNQLERFLDVGAHELVQLATTVVLIGAAFFAIAPEVAWVAFLPIPVIAWGSLRFQRAIEPRYAAVRAEAGRIAGILATNLEGIATIKAFTAEAREADRIRAASDRYRVVNRRAIAMSSAFVPLIRLAILVAFTATLVLGGFLALDGRMNVGLYSVMVFLTQRLLWPLTRVGETIDLYERAMASSRRIFEVLDTEPATDSGELELDAATASESLVLSDVRFAYPDGREVLHGVDLVVEAGGTTAIVGPTGSGKTTIVKLLLRFHDPDEGTIELAGIDLRKFRVGSLRRRIAFVGQEVFLFEGTIRENIAYGRPDASDEEIEAAARAAEAHGFITELPDGYATMVGARGRRLSGGQRQRISLARALLTEAPIMILDEATSAVDNETEAAIQRSLRRVAHRRTLVVIAHRLSTVRHADRIYVLENGRITDAGTHDELVARPGTYADLWRVQTGEA
ncbi:MAG TPA: ABC transporter ATP-binding protein [Actinobacteria bacterium]|nr:ABC transporter ATP-binding protein [Actinomycetota bacterium]